jgi:hypothetical protein
MNNAFRQLRVYAEVAQQVMRMWNVVHLRSKLLSPASEALRYFIIERGEAHLPAHDAPLLKQAKAGASPR